jgi:Protein of unknown function (DUF1638)
VRRVLVIACGALVRELRAVLAQINAPEHVAIDVEYLPAPLHNRPERIRDAVLAVVESKGSGYDEIVLGYADCGTGGHLEALGYQMLPGSHCYEFFAGHDVFEALHDAEPGTFYLTDYLARHFDALVIGSLGLDRHPELRDAYFGNYTRLVYLSQTNDASLLLAGQAGAERLGLAFEHRPTGLAPFTLQIRTLVS